jgi:hypothetical protein
VYGGIVIMLLKMILTDVIIVDPISGSNDLQVRLVCIPQFAQTYSCIALNLRTLECVELSFQQETIEIIS